jgi:phosphate transport system substrate-binding protein
VAGRGRRGFRLRSAALYIAIGAALAACGAPAGTTSVTTSDVTRSARTATLTETGSGLLYPLARTWAADYAKATPGVTVTTASTGSGAGIAAASAGKADIGASDAYLSSGDLVLNSALVNIPLVVSAQTVIYHLPGVSGHVRLDGAVLAGIYDGTITRWNDPAITAINQGLTLPAIKIVPVRRSDSSGVPRTVPRAVLPAGRHAAPCCTRRANCARSSSASSCCRSPGARSAPGWPPRTPRPPTPSSA